MGSFKMGTWVHDMDKGLFQQSRNGVILDIIILYHLRYKTPIKQSYLPETETGRKTLIIVGK